MSDCRMQNKFIMLRIFLRLALQERNLLSFLCQFGWQMHKIWQEAMDSLTARLALAQEHASEHFLQKILTGIFRTTQELTLPKCKRHLHKISWEFSQNILLTRMQHTTLLMSQIINLCASSKEYLNHLLNVNKENHERLSTRIERTFLCDQIVIELLVLSLLFDSYSLKGSYLSQKCLLLDKPLFLHTQECLKIFCQKSVNRGL